MKILLLKTLRDLRASLAQTIALLVITALGVASLIALVGAYRDLDSSYNRTYDQLKLADVTFQVQAMPAAAVQAVGRVAGVRATAGRLVIDTGFELPSSADGAQGERIRSRLIGIPPDQHPAVNDVLVLDGHYLTRGENRAVLVESHFAAYYHLKPGDAVTPIINGQPVTFTIAGIAASPEYLIVSPGRQDILPSARTFAVIYMGLPELQALAGTGDVVNDVNVLIDPTADQAHTVGDVKGLLNTYGMLGATLKKDQPSNAALKADLDGYRELAGIMPILILLAAAASVYVMLGRQVRSQQSIVGLMKALGYGNGAVMVHYLTSALAIGLVGSILGVLCGFPLAGAITGEYAGELGIPLVQANVYPDLMAAGVLLSLAVTVLAGIGPSRGAMRMAPAEAMRLDPTVGLDMSRPSLVERLLRPPLWVRLPLRNVFRARRRSLTTALGIILAFALILMVIGMLDSMNSVLNHTFQDVERWDAIALFNQPQTQATLDTIGKWPGVRAVEPILQAPAHLKANGHEEDLLLTALDPGQMMHRLYLSANLSSRQALAAGHVVLTKAVADQDGLKVGDTVSLETPLGKRDLIVGGTVDEFMSGVAYMSMADAQKWAGITTLLYNGVYLQADPPQAQAIKTALYGLPSASSVQLKSGIEEDWRTLTDLFYALMGVMLIFAVAMAFALLFNAMTVNVLERQRELATMRAIGTSQGRVALLMISENALLWVMTLVPGLLVGYEVAVLLGAVFNSELFSLPVVIVPSSYVLTALGILVTMILATLPAIRRVNHLNLAQATKVLT